MASDPVCGTEVDEREAVAPTEYVGRTSYVYVERRRDAFISEAMEYG